MDTTINEWRKNECTKEWKNKCMNEKNNDSLINEYNK